MRVGRRIIAYSLLFLGTFCAFFGLYFFEVYSPLRNSVGDPNVILWYPIGLALMLGGVASVVASSLELDIGNLHRKMDDTNTRLREVSDGLRELRQEVDGLVRKEDKLQAELEGHTRHLGELGTTVEEFASTTEAEFKGLSEMLKKEGKSKPAG